MNDKELQSLLEQLGEEYESLEPPGPVGWEAQALDDLADRLVDELDLPGFVEIVPRPVLTGDWPQPVASLEPALGDAWEPFDFPEEETTAADGAFGSRPFLRKSAAGLLITGVCALLLICWLALRPANKLPPAQPALPRIPNSSSESVGLIVLNPLRCLSWNIESDGNDPATMSKQLVELGRYDIYALQEVKSENFGRYADAIRKGISNNFRYIGSTTGRSDRLMIIFDSARLRLLEATELFGYGDFDLNDWRHRSPFVARFQDRQSAEEFLFVTVHLARGNAHLRTEQATGLREWAKAQKLPIVAIGDFNMDYDFPTQKGNAAFDAMLADETWEWVQPDELIDTNWHDPDGDGKDNYPDSMLDFCFVRGVPNATSRVIVRDGDFPDDERTADHRPVELVVD